VAKFQGRLQAANALSRAAARLHEVHDLNLGEENRAEPVMANRVMKHQSALV